MAAVDQYGREILSEPISKGGVRYFDADKSISFGLNPGDDAAALAKFNANPPPKFAPKKPDSNPAADELLDKLEAMTSEQKQRLKKLMAAVLVD